MVGEDYVSVHTDEVKKNIYNTFLKYDEVKDHIYQVV